MQPLPTDPNEQYAELGASLNSRPFVRRAFSARESRYRGAATPLVSGERVSYPNALGAWWPIRYGPGRRFDSWSPAEAVGRQKWAPFHRDWVDQISPNLHLIDKGPKGGNDVQWLRLISGHDVALR
jgi:hypothetical protein